MDEEHLAIAEIGYSPDDPAVIAAALRVRSELAVLGRRYGRFADLASRSTDCFATDVLKHHRLLEGGC
ncbi:hypothetical protein CH249_01315 [Rhodococcus sp. 05-2255-3B1]|nr:hypothetical protein CH249_01315 [Rhodococcus sp. 05-2255-3B1]OZE18961.1 hypothetical protein CH255_13340 [Rhodococcus sp. 05-2255-2A2]